MIRIYSPIPPLPCQSAQQIGEFLRENESNFRGEEVSLIVDGSFYGENRPHHYLEYPVEDFRVEKIPEAESITHFIFLASNAYHDYCYRALEAPKEGPTIAIVAQTLEMGLPPNLRHAWEIWIKNPSPLTARVFNRPVYSVHAMAQTIEGFLYEIRSSVK